MSDNQQAGQPQPPPETHQFDFWLGEWDVWWREPDSDVTGGTNRIERSFDGHVIVEHFDGQPGTPLQGMSVSVFDIRTGKWYQTWVDNAGGYLDFSGAFSDGKMILSREAEIDGKPIKQRMVWFDIQPDSLHWNWERSGDGGATWAVVWAITYKRRK